MDNVKLTNEQLRKLITFIEKRGFHDPGVIVEILDHFACKVEEQLTIEPQLTIDEAIYKAHRSFGTLGFQPLVATYYESTRKKFKALYWREWKKALANPYYIIPALLVSFAIYKLYGIADVHISGMIFNLSSFVLFIGAFAAMVLVSWRFKILKRKGRFLPTVMGRNLYYIFICTMPVLHDHRFSPTGISFFSTINALAAFYITVNSIATYAVLMIGRKEMDPVYDYLENKGFL